MLYDLKWLSEGQDFPPKSERARLKRYEDNEKLFAGDHMEITKEIYAAAATRINRVIGNFEDVISFPVILNYQRLLSVKTSDLVCGEFPGITGSKTEDTNKIKEIREATSFDEQLFASVIDISRYGETVWRVFKDEDTDKGTFVPWTPKEWFPIVKNDGTFRIAQQVLAWRVNLGTDEKPDWRLRVQIHDKGKYLDEEYQLDNTNGNKIMSKLNSREVPTGLSGVAVFNVRSIATTGTVYGYDDYVPIDSIVAEILVRVAQIAAILDKHADPALAGPVSMLKQNPDTGRYYLEVGNFFGISEDEELPQYLTWDGKLDASFKQLELLIDQLYILSEMGSALLGASDKNGQAISGTAMRFKMVNPLTKARRIANQMTTPVKRLLAAISELGYTKIEWNTISIVWKDGLPNDPVELAEQAKRVTGAKQVMPMVEAIQEFFEKTPEEAQRWYDLILKDMEKLSPPKAEPGVPDPRKKDSKNGFSDQKPDKDKQTNKS